MSARFTGTPSLSPRHVCQIHGHTKLVTPACLPDSPAHQACYPGMSARFTGTSSLSPRHVCQIYGHTKLVTPACLPDSRALQACHPGMSARFTGTSSLLPRLVCQIHGHYKLATPACLPDSRALQACYPLLSARFAGTSSLSPAQNCPFSGHSEAIPPQNRPFPAHSAPFPPFSVLSATCEARFDAADPGRAHGGACSLRDPARDPLPGRVTSGTLALLQTGGGRFLGTPRDQSTSGVHQARLAQSTRIRRRRTERASMTRQMPSAPLPASVYCSPSFFSV